MKKTFHYLRPADAREACVLKARYGDSARFWAGGTDLLPQWRDGGLDIDYCIDLSFLSSLEYVRSSPGEGLSIGALTRLAEIEGAAGIQEAAPVLARAAGRTATPQVRSLATIGGNLCNAAPSADMAPPLLVLGAEVDLLNDSGSRRLPLEDFFLGVGRTALRPDELLVGIRVPPARARRAAAFQKLARTSVDIALVNAAVALTLESGGVCVQARIALGAVAPVPLRARGAEAVLVGEDLSRPPLDLLDRVAGRAAAETKPISDVRASAEYRREISRVLVRRALEDVVRRLGGRPI